MRTIHIDFTNPENVLPDGNVLGNQGEHNATVLVVTPPQEMTDNENITSYRLAFELTNCRTVHSKDIAKSDAISLPLFSQITSSETIAVQLEGYDNDGNIVVKSEKVSKLKFNPSVCGVEIPRGDSPNSMSAEVKLNTKFRENFGEDEDGNLKYKGNFIGSANRPTDTLELVSTNGFLTTDNSHPTEFSFVIGDIWGQIDDETLKVGTEIKKIELSVNGYEDWQDIHEIHTIDDIPHLVEMSKVYNSIMGYKIFAVVTALYRESFYVSFAKNLNPIYIRITYYTD